MDFIAFYWTLPVPWAGFTELPRDPDEAARQSRTIRYQVERVRRWVTEQNGRLVGEEVFLELQPDRGTSYVTEVIDPIIEKARRQHSKIVLVDFAQALGWRPHGPLWRRLQASGCVEALDPVPILLDAGVLDPLEHFRAWRRIEEAHRSSKDDRRALAANVIRRLREENRSYPAIAAALNGQGLKTPTGRNWTPENVRKLASGGSDATPGNG